MQFKLGELFCGPGGMSLGAKLVKFKHNAKEYGFSHQWATDYDSDSCETFRKNICPNSPETVYHCDVRDLDISSLAPIDVLAFGFPCNDYSIVGEKKGMDGKFGMLYQYGVKVLEEHNPKAFVAENVSGIKGANEGKAWTKITSDLEKAGKGYDLYIHHYYFEHYGVPQRRHRYIIVGIRKDLKLNFSHPVPTTKHNPRTCFEALHDPEIPEDASHHEIRPLQSQVQERLSYIKPGDNAWSEDIPERLRLNVKGARLSNIYRRMHPDLPAYTITGSGGGGTHGYHWSENRALTNREKARVQTFPDHYEFVGGATSVRKQIGMAVPPIGAKVIFDELARSLATTEHKGYVNNDKTDSNMIVHESQSFRQNLHTEIPEADRIDIVSGYLGKSAADEFGHGLVDCVRKRGTVRILIGMAGVEGLSAVTHQAWSSIHEQMQAIDSKSGVFSYKLKIHSKVYLFSRGKEEKMYLGSQNFNFSSGNLELIIESETHPDVRVIVDSYFSDVGNLLPISAVSIKGSATDPLRMRGASHALPNHAYELDHRKMEIIESIDLRALCEKNPIASLNLYHGKGRLNSNTGIYTPRPWYEVELSIGKNNHPNLPKQFNAFTDEGKVIEMHRSGGGPTGYPELGVKDLTGKGSGGRVIFGEWIKGKLEAAGALEPGEVIDGSTFDSYGADQLEFYRISEDEFYMKFSPEDQ